jgi:hypothetical protein
MKMRITIVLLTTIGYCYAGYFDPANNPFDIPIRQAYPQTYTSYGTRTIKEIPVQPTNIPATSLQAPTPNIYQMGIPQASIPEYPMEQVRKIEPLEQARLRPLIPK